MNDQGEGKIHFDADWKAEAEAEKQKLVEEEIKAGPGESAGEMPAPTMMDVIQAMAMPAAMALGGYATPDGKSVPPDLGAAKYHIDLLAVLEEKTKGNLTDQEGKALGGLLYELRMQFTQIVSSLASGGKPSAS